MSLTKNLTDDSMVGSPSARPYEPERRQAGAAVDASIVAVAEHCAGLTS